MRVEKALARLRRALGTERTTDALRSVARDAAHALPKANGETIAALRGGLAGVSLKPWSYDAGIRDGILEVLSAGDAAWSRRIEEQHDIKTAIRENWAPLLSLLRERPLLPTEIATALNLGTDVVSRRLEQLRAAGYAEVQVHQADARKRPHRLTLKGTRVAAELPESLSQSSRLLIRFAVQFFAQLETTGRLTRSNVAEIAQESLGGSGVSAEQTSELIVAETINARLAMDPGSTGVIVRTGFAGVADTLKTSLGTSKLPEVLFGIPGINPSETTLVVRSDRFNDWWNALFAVADSPYAREIAVGTADLRAGFVLPKQDHFIVVYDSPQLLQQDKVGGQSWTTQWKEVVNSAAIKAFLVDPLTASRDEPMTEPDLVTLRLAG